MRKIIFLILFSASSVAMAQSFEGTITWKITTDVADPATKAQMDQAQQQMQSPEAQEQMKEMKKQMEDPQFKAMMEANPKMKEQMEQAMKMMESSDFSSMIPTGMLMKFKGKKLLTKIEGGMTSNMEVLNQGDGKSYFINREDKTYWVQEDAENEDDYEDTETTVTKTKETKKILNYTCTKYIVTTSEEEENLEQYIWATNDIKDLTMADFFNDRREANGQLALDFAKIDGVPLRVETGAEGMKMIMEVTEIKRGGVSAADVEIPSDFKKTTPGF